MFSSKCKIEQKHILHQFSNPSNVNLRVIIVPSVIVFTAHRKGPACSLNPHQSGECIGWMFVEQLDVVHNRFQPDQRAEKSNKTQNVLISSTRIYCIVLSKASLGLRGNSTTTIVPSGCSKKQLMACLSNLLSAFFLSFLLNGPSNPAEMSPDIFSLSTGDYFKMLPTSEQRGLDNCLTQTAAESVHLKGWDSCFNFGLLTFSRNSCKNISTGWVYTKLQCSNYSSRDMVTSYFLSVIWNMRRCRWTSC